MSAPAVDAGAAAREAETEDAFLGGRVLLRQPKTGLRAGLDAVMLAAACRAESGEAVLEAGCGAGAASLCLAARVGGPVITGVDIDARLVRLAEENARRNGVASFTAVLADVTAPWAALEAAGLRPNRYDHVLANPPFHTPGTTRTPRDPERGAACVMPEGGLDRWLRFLAAAARPGGTLTLIHRGDALIEVLRAAEGRFGALEVIPLFPKAGAGAVRVILRGVKGSRAPLTVRQGLVLHAADGSQTAQAAEILRNGKSLDAMLH